MGSLQRVVAFEYIPDGAGPVKLRLGLGLAHLHFLPLGLVNEQLPGLGALEGAYDAPLLHLIHQPGSPGIAQLQRRWSMETLARPVSSTTSTAAGSSSSSSRESVLTVKVSGGLV